MDDRHEPRTGRVRIVGAEPVGEAPPFDDEPMEEELADDLGLPHWTEAPTGQVPAVLSGDRDPSDDPWASLPEPTWREEQSDWAAHEEAFDPSVLASTDEVTEDEAERQPWSFELDELSETAQLPAVGSQADHAARRRDDEVFDELAEPRTIEGAEEEDPWRYGERAAIDHLADTGEVEEVGSDGYGDGYGAGAGDDDGYGDGDDGYGAGGEDDDGYGGGPALADWPADETVHEAAHDTAHETAHGAARRSVHGSASPAAPAAPAAPAGGRNLPVAIATGAVIGAVALVCFALGTVSSMVVATAVVALAAIEAFAAFRKAGYRPATLLGLVAVVGVMIGVYNRGEAAEPLVLVLLVAFTLLWQLVGVDRGAEPVRSTVSTVFVYCWVGVFGSYAALLLSPTVFSDRHGIAYLLGAVITVVAYDVAALAVGSWLGRHPLSAISPNKTWEGLVGGTVVAIVVAVAVVHLIHPWTVGSAAVLGVAVAVVAPIGDLAESLVKRHVGLKDMGRVLPGHGGLLDRVDGLLFVLPATYYLVRALHLG